MKTAIKTVFLFTNGMIAAFDSDGEQIPGAQSSIFDVWAEAMEQKGYDPNGAIVTMPGSNTLEIFERDGTGQQVWGSKFGTICK